METYWQEHKTRLRHYIAKQVDNADAVDDILQDVYIKAHTRLHTLKSRESIGAWLYRIAYNAIMDHFRQQTPWDELPDSLEAPEDNESEKTHQEVAGCIKPLINELPEKYSVPLQMFELEGMTQKQVAEKLGLSLSGAKSRIQRGRTQLRDKFTSCCDIEVEQGWVSGYTIKDESCNEYPDR